MPVPFAFTKVATRRIAGLLVATMFAVDVPIANAQRAMDSRTCAAYFWVGQQCALPQFRDSYTNAFMFLARANAQREGRPSPLTQDDATLCESGKQWLAHSVRTSQQ